MIVEPEEGKTLNFIEQIIEEELLPRERMAVGYILAFRRNRTGTCISGMQLLYVLNFGLATEYHGKCNLRFDDTNPSKEDVEYIDSIQQDIQWLGFQWEGPNSISHLIIFNSYMIGLKN